MALLRRPVPLAAIAVVVFSALGCAAGFSKIYPGMTSHDVVEAMGSGPSRAQEYPENYSAWYYGDDRCILLKQDVVVSKQHSEYKNTVITPLGGYDERHAAQCLPPGVQATQPREHDVYTPFGNVRVQDSAK